MTGMPTPASRNWVLVSWDGSSAPLEAIHLDAPPDFDWVLFDYSGRSTAGPWHTADGQRVWRLSQATECKGDIYQALAAHLAEHCRQAPPPTYVGLLDDDIVTSVSDLNRALHIARTQGLDVFSMTLSHDSHCSHRWMRSQGRNMLRHVDWVEVMMPFYRSDLLLAAAPHLQGNTSSWGVDRYLMPMLQKLHGLERTALLDRLVAAHLRPVTSGQRVYRNGLTAAQERDAMKRHCQQQLQAQRPDLLGTDWYWRLYLRRHERTRWQRLHLGLGRRIRQWLEASL